MNSAINKEDDIRETRGVGGGREVLCYNITFLLSDGKDSVKNLGKSIANSRTSRAQRQRWGEAWHVLGTK